MGSVIEYKVCECGNTEKTSDFYYKSDELYEFCDCCGYYYVRKIINRPANGEYPEDWKPEYEESQGKTGFVFKVFEKDRKGVAVMTVQKKDVRDTINSLLKDTDVVKFLITFKDRNTKLYQTEIFSKIK